MRGIKPFKLSFVTRPFQWGPSMHLGIGVLAYARLGEPEIFTDFEMWMNVPEVLGEIPLDVGIPKSRAEFLFVGNAYRPGGIPGTTQPVRIRVGSIDKSLYVIGDRYWRGGVPSDPIPFTSMSLGWQNAFGGEGYDKNPLGKGFAPVTDDDGNEVHPLPNVEAPGNMITSPKDRPEPAGFGVLDFVWPQRFSMAGTYDNEWLETRFPGFAKDLDWRIWMCGAPDQQQDEPFRGDETILCENLHPGKPKIEGRLPPLVPRCFVEQHRGAGTVLEEVELKLTTVWVLPELERIVLVWHGAQPIAEDDAVDIETVMVAGEKLGEPRPMEHYREVFAKRTGEERALEALNEQDLFPAEWAGLGPDMDEAMAATSPENLVFERQWKAMAAMIEERREMVAAEGLDPDQHGPVMPERPEEPTLQNVGEILKKVQEEAAQKKQEADAYHERVIGEMREFYEESGLDFDEVEREMAEPFHRGPPTFRADAERKYFRDLADKAAALGQPQEELEMFATDEGWYDMWKEQERSELEMYRGFAHNQLPAYALEEEVNAVRRADVESAVRRNESLAGWDLTGANLAGMDLSGADLRMALMESVDLQAARIERANLDGAMLAHSNLSAASFAGSSMRGANLGKAVCRATNISSCDLRDAILQGIDLTGADLSGSNLAGSNLRAGTYTNANLSRINLQTGTVLELSLEGVNLTGADLMQVTFYKVDLSGLDLSGARLQEATLVACRGEEAKFVNAQMVGIRTMMGCSLRRSDLKGADLSKANLREVDLSQCDLAGARLTGADLSGANLEEARLYRIVARQSLWIRTNLQRAQLVSADLFEAMLEKADLRGADLRGANLYAANFALIHSDADTRVEDSIQDRVRILPKREEGQ